MHDYTRPVGVRVRPDAPLIGLDIDGTIGDYHAHFTWFASMYLERELVPDWNLSLVGDFDVALGLDKSTYRQIKLAYRQSGLKRTMPTRMGANICDIVQSIRESGVAVWIATTRPWLRLDNIDPDTRYWIRTRVGRVDGVVFGEEKYQDLLDLTEGRKVLGVFDDLPENIDAATNLGLRASIFKGPHNCQYPHARGFAPGVSVIEEPSEILSDTLRWMEEEK